MSTTPPATNCSDTSLLKHTSTPQTSHTQHRSTTPPYPSTFLHSRRETARAIAHYTSPPSTNPIHTKLLLYAHLPWTRAQLYTQTISPAPPIFLSCNLTHPVHLASILAHGCGDEVVWQVAGGMTPARLSLLQVGEGEGEGEGEGGGDGKGKGCVRRVTEGMLVGGLREEVRMRLERVFKERYGEAYERVVEEVDVWVGDGGVVVVVVPVYVYRRGRGRG